MRTRTQAQYQRDMFDAMPKCYEEGRISRNIIERQAKELADLDAAIKDVFDQYFIDTTTWGLANWERVCGIVTDENKPLDQRRSAIKAKIRGIGPVTKEMIQRVVSAWFGEEIDVIERFANYEVMIEFLFDKAVGKNFTDIIDTLRELLPAHLNFGFAPSLKEYVSINEKATVNMRRYHRIGEFRIGMRFMKYQSEVELS